MTYGQAPRIGGATSAAFVHRCRASRSDSAAQLRTLLPQELRSRTFADPEVDALADEKNAVAVQSQDWSLARGHPLVLGRRPTATAVGQPQPTRSRGDCSQLNGFLRIALGSVGPRVSVRRAPHVRYHFTRRRAAHLRSGNAACAVATPRGAW